MSGVNALAGADPRVPPGGPGEHACSAAADDAGDSEPTRQTRGRREARRTITATNMGMERRRALSGYRLDRELGRGGMAVV